MRAIGSEPKLNHGRATRSASRSANIATPAALQSSPSATVTSNTAEASKKAWTVLYYGAGDNNLDSYITQDVAHMEQVGTDPATNIVVQLDHSKGTASRFLLQKDVVPNEKIDSPVLQELGDVNMGDPKQLQNFIEWGIKKYPAENYVLLVASHGKGWKGVCRDGEAGWMEIPQMQQALQSARETTGEKLALIGFDACLMASTEVAYQLRNEANFMVASQEVEGQNGWPYNLVLDPDAIATMGMSSSITSASVTPKQLATYLVSRTTSNPQDIPTMSAIDLSKMDNVANAAKELGTSIIGNKTNQVELRKIRDSVQKFAEYHDAGDFAQHLIDVPGVKSNDVKAKAANLQGALDEAVIAEQHSEKFPNAHGLTVELRWPKGYKNTEFAANTGWEQLIGYMNS
jgi:hypothetical protein